MFKILVTTLLLCLGLALAATVVLAATALIYPSGYPDPFAPFEDLEPGNPMPELESLTCEVQSLSSYPQSGSERTFTTLLCKADPNDHVSQIQIRTCDGIIQSVLFKVDEIQILDLVRHWGKPISFVATNSERDSFMFHWSSEIYAATHPRSNPTYQAWVQRIFLDHAAETFC